MAPAQAHPRIFVQIASYRDAECHHTITDLFEKAAHPERISVGICWQYDPEEDAEFLAVPYPRPEQVRAIQFHSKDAQGAGWARAQAQTLWNGEEYTLQIQAHMRFEQDWDETLLEMLAACPSEKPALTAWLPNYVPPDKKEKPTGGFHMCVAERIGEAHDPQILHLGKRMLPAAMVRDKVLPTPFWVGNFLFVRSAALQEVPPDPHIYFWGEELSYSARLWTHGYDLFHLNRVVMYHFWHRFEAAKDEKIYRDRKSPRNQRSLARLRALLHLGQTKDEAALRDLARYGLGTARSLDAFLAFAGLDLKKGLISDKAKKGEWSMELPEPTATSPAAAEEPVPETPSPAPAREQAQAPSGRPRIFVAMASYRDPQCQPTVEDLFAKATHAERIVVGVCLQVDPKQDKNCLLNSPFPEQTRIVTVNAEDSKGANWARAEAMKLAKDEEYVLQIDSHMRFEAGWDEALLEMLSRCPSQKPVLTGWLHGYAPPNRLVEDSKLISRMMVNHLGEPGEAQLVNYYRREVPSIKVKRPEPAGGVIANFVFAARAAFDEVPHDPHIDFWGDEINQSARLWTHGWDFFQLDRNLAYHFWDRMNAKDRADYRNRQNSRHKKARVRNLHLFGIELSVDENALAELSSYPLGRARNIEDYWAYLGVDLRTQTVSEKAHKGEWGEKAEPITIASSKPVLPPGQLPRIFVNIASYRDPECQATVDNIFERATHPDRIFVGICLQVDAQADTNCLVYSDRSSQVSIIQVDYRDSAGANWARALAQSIWKGEEYVLQIDSHMRFEQGWDETMIDMIARCPSARPVLSTYVPRYMPPNNLTRYPGEILRIRAQMFGKKNMPQLLHLTRAHVKLADKERSGLYRSPFIIANFIFAPAMTFSELPFDAHIPFWGDEISMAARMWTHGYDIYQPDKVVIYHYWRRDELVSVQPYRNPNNRQGQLSYQRVRHLLGLEKAQDARAIENLDHYGLGTVRPLSELWEFAGIDWQTQHISEGALDGRWNVPEPLLPAPAPLAAVDATPQTVVEPEIPELVDIAQQIELAAAPEIVQAEEELLKAEYIAREEQPAAEETAPAQQADELPEEAAEETRAEEIEEIVAAVEEPVSLPEPDLTPAPVAAEPEPFKLSLMDARKPTPANTAPVTLVSAPEPRKPESLPPEPVVAQEAPKRRSKKSSLPSRPQETQPLQLAAASTDTPAQLPQITSIKQAAPSRKAAPASGLTAAAPAPKHAIAPLPPLPNDAVPRIFVNIASYRDPECQWTVKDLFEKANNPDRIFVGICWQFDPEHDEDCFKVSTRPEQVRVYPCNWWDAEGVSWARNITQQLWEGEEYTLMIDAHMRFMQGWDDLMIEELAKCPAPKPVLSCSPPRYLPPNELDDNITPAIRRVKPFAPDGTIRCQGEWIEFAPPHPLNAAFLVANFVFSRAEIIREVPYDPYLYFEEEEITYAARLYTHGWDIFSPTRQFLYHYYNDPNAEGGSVRNLHWRDMHQEQDHKAKIRFLKDRALRRFNHLTGYRDSSDPEVLKELDIYGWGTVRTLDEFEAYSGVDFKHKVATDRALRCLFIKDLHKYRRIPIHIKEIDGPPPTPHIAVSQPALTVRQAEPRPATADKPVIVKDSPQKPATPAQEKAYTPPAGRQFDPRFPIARPRELSTLERGDFIPLFELPNTLGTRNIDIYGGEHCLLVFLPAHPHYIAQFLQQIDRYPHKETMPSLRPAYVIDADIEEVKALKEKLKLPHSFFADKGRKLAQAFGICGSREPFTPPAGYVLSPNLRILKRHINEAPADMANLLMESWREETGNWQRQNSSPRIITRQAPVLILPEVFSPEFCDRCIESFNKGQQFDGTVGRNAKNVYDPKIKSRTDHIPRHPLLHDIDEKLSRALFPEIRKVFGFEVTHREVYKIGKYEAEKGGFFRQHRDNFDAPMAYRRIAMTLHLNEDYEGGGVRFPEYSEDIYLPPRGSVVAFSCATMHEARKVTAGNRYILVGFFHGLEDEAYRRHYRATHQIALDNEEFTPMLRHNGAIREHRAEVNDWRKRHMSYYNPEADETVEILPVTGGKGE